MQDFSSKFKNATNQHLLKALFYEEAVDSGFRDNVLFTLKLEDHLGFPSLHRLYVEFDDPTEYFFANEYLDGWAHWKKLCACNWFKPYLNAMREELDLSIRARALKKLREIGSKDMHAFQVNKYLLEKGWVDKEDKRGRPSKEAIKKEADKMVKADEAVLDDYGRIMANA